MFVTLEKTDSPHALLLVIMKNRSCGDIGNVTVVLVPITVKNSGQFVAGTVTLVEL